ncbi:MAG: BON domain-containing protein [Armatimonadota bacterium]|nr:BON domain-containing protein [Armatimonadota bacterium]MDR5702935.1 BON domain-containing protein [Armatimonadota bacterium]MDR7433874.1 BON domain-containing protein [Armatimonadota bacterium]
MPFIGDEILAAQVKAAISMCTSIGIEPIRVKAKDRVVILAGSVQTLEQREWAERIAAGIPGVRGVINSLLVREPEGSSTLGAA